MTMTRVAVVLVAALGSSCDMVPLAGLRCERPADCAPDLVCDAETLRCAEAPTATSEGGGEGALQGCVANPLLCGAGTHCEVDTALCILDDEGLQGCVANPLRCGAGTRCNPDTALCVLDDDNGEPQGCVANPLLCGTGTHCDVGTALCVLDGGQGGEGEEEAQPPGPGLVIRVFTPDRTTIPMLRFSFGPCTSGTSLEECSTWIEAGRSCGLANVACNADSIVFVRPNLHQGDGVVRFSVSFDYDGDSLDDTWICIGDGPQAHLTANIDVTLDGTPITARVVDFDDPGVPDPDGCSAGVDL